MAGVEEFTLMEMFIMGSELMGKDKEKECCMMRRKIASMKGIGRIISKMEGELRYEMMGLST
eukprot:CAMPEP_0168313962 /NCGR_PEP_ID=MMETSP0210-20121227/5521_1 /TAXON_ID=40633 /ORGANISM="Condylostoma magnum, Strain COL2" /LENGTH=61 /DNA_ID=CAMNT_0008277155 /DNA_START=372 /DNA_END=557 /DNA_ORIENTATION=+